MKQTRCERLAKEKLERREATKEKIALIFSFTVAYAVMLLGFYGIAELSKAIMEAME